MLFIVCPQHCAIAGRGSAAESILPLRHPELSGRPSPALRASEPIAEPPNPCVLLDAILPDQLIRRNLHFATALTAYADYLAPAKIIEVGSVRWMKLPAITHQALSAVGSAAL